MPLFICARPLGNTVTVLNGPVLAEDKDIGPNAVVKYRLLGARVDLFTVDADTGNYDSSASTHREKFYLFLHIERNNISVSPSRCDTCASGCEVGP